MINTREQRIIEFVGENKGSSSKEIFDGTNIPISYATLKRILTKLTSEKFVVTEGRGKGTKYFPSPTYELIRPIDIDKYYENEIDTFSANAIFRI